MALPRVEKLRTFLTEKNLDAMLVLRPENRVYLSGFTGSAGALVITREQAMLVTDFRYLDQAAEQAKGFEIRRVATTLQQVVADLLAEAGAGRVGYEANFITVDEFEQFTQLLVGRELVSATGLVENLRLIKDEDELGRMRRAAAIADESFRRILPLIKPGAIERDLALELEFQMKRLGAEQLAFDTIVASGVRSSLPHGIASEKVIEQGDLVTFDFGAKYRGYCSDMTRTVVVGEPADQQRQIYSIVLEAQERGLAACRAGITGKDLDEVCRSYIREAGYGDSFGHGTGHGVGLFIHEGPPVNVRGEGAVLQPGMIVTIEPGIYLAGWGGVRIEDMVLVTETGCERFSLSPKELLIL